MENNATADQSKPDIPVSEEFLPDSIMVFALSQEDAEIVGHNLVGNEAFRFPTPDVNQVMDYRECISSALHVHPLTLTFYEEERRLQDADRVMIATQAIVVKTEAALPPLHVSFGEATGLPVKVLKASYTVCPAMPLNRCLLKLQLEVVNELIHSQISAKLRIPLPPDAAVCRFLFERAGTWFPAVPVEAKKAQEVVYKEREKGREVAKAGQAQGNVFEIEVFPLAFQTPARCELWFQAEAWVPLRFDSDTIVTIDGQPLNDWKPSEDTRNVTKRQLEARDVGKCCIGECFGAKHFACFVPPCAGTDSALQAVTRLAIIWDTSTSQEDADRLVRFRRLRGLAAQCAADVSINIYSFSMGFRQEIDSASIDVAIEILQNLCYDGGTNLNLIPEILAQVGNVDAVLLFSNGMDSLNRRPKLENRSCPPIYSVVDQAQVDLSVLHSLSLTSGGQILQDDYLPVIRTQSQVRLTVEGAKGSEFHCSPDPEVPAHLGAQGYWVCGILGTATKITAEVLATGGRIQQELCFDLTAAPDLGPDAAPLIGYLYATQLYANIEKNGTSTCNVDEKRAQLAVRYGLVTKEASLLMLYEAAQFVENQIGCPEDHPAYEAWLKATARHEGVKVTPEEVPKGDIGQPKTPEQLKMVATLASRLRTYMESPIKKVPTVAARRGTGGIVDVDSDRSLGGCGGRGTSGIVDEEIACIAAGSRIADVACGSAPRARRSLDRGSIGSARSSAIMNCAESMRMPRLQSEAVACCEESVSMDFAESVPMPMLKSAPKAFGSALMADDRSEAGSEMSCGASLSSEGAKCADLQNRCAASPNSAASLGLGAAMSDLPSFHSENIRGVVQQHKLGKEQEYLEALKLSLESGVDWESKYRDLKRVHGASPSFFLYTAGLVLKCGFQEAAVRICSNCLELNIQDVQMMRSVAYFLIKAGVLELAIALFDRVRELAPVEPQSFLDGALARAFRLRQPENFTEPLLREAVQLAAHAVTHKWADRFSEIEWPALILIHALVGVAEARGITHELWPLEEDWKCPPHLFKLGLFIWLGWDTDKTDIDLHVIEPSGEEVYYSNNASRSGGILSRDFTEGYGPEVYLSKEPPNGKYNVLAKYYASHQQSGLTGATSAIVWVLQEGMEAGDMQFDSVRLDTDKEKMQVMTVTVENEASKSSMPGRCKVCAIM